MPLVEKSPPDEVPTDPFAWDPDPVVLVSRRPRILYFPHVLLQRDATPEEVRRWAGANDENTAGRRRDEQMFVQAGVTFLGTMMTSSPAGCSTWSASERRATLSMTACARWWNRYTHGP